eukprot:4486514-Amphidinium_carterae.2
MATIIGARGAMNGVARSFSVCKPLVSQSSGDLFHIPIAPDVCYQNACALRFTLQSHKTRGTHVWPFTSVQWNRMMRFLYTIRVAEHSPKLVPSLECFARALQNLHCLADMEAIWSIWLGRLHLTSLPGLLVPQWSRVVEFLKIALNLAPSVIGSEGHAAELWRRLRLQVEPESSTRLPEDSRTPCFGSDSIESVGSIVTPLLRGRLEAHVVVGAGTLLQSLAVEAVASKSDLRAQILSCSLHGAQCSSAGFASHHFQWLVIERFVVGGEAERLACAQDRLQAEFKYKTTLHAALTRLVTGTLPESGLREVTVFYLYTNRFVGVAEHAVRELNAKTRGLRLLVEEMHNVTLVQIDAIVVWMVLFASMIISIGRRGKDGRSAWELRYGRNCGRARSADGRVQRTGALERR